MSPWDLVRRYSEKREHRVIGLMSGTSIDGVDAVAVRISGSGKETKIDVDAFVTYPFPADLRERTLEMCHGSGNAEEVSRLNFLLGSLFADAADAVRAKASLESGDIDLIASHGQTVSHTAPDATLQIGEASILAQRFGVPVVSDFRTADLAAGGQGAPLIPYADWCLLTHPTRARAVQNIGGIGNVTYLPADAAADQVIGFDTGPGNMLIDRAAEFFTNGRLKYDKDGKMAAHGKVDDVLLEKLLNHPFLLKAPPKSAGREEFGMAYFEHIVAGFGIDSDEPSGSAESVELTTFLPSRGGKEKPFNRAMLELFQQQLRERTVGRAVPKPEDVVATLTAFTALSIADAYDRFLPTMPSEVIVGGGGARNPTLLKMLEARLAPTLVRTHEHLGMSSDNKEAVAFALLGNETMLGNPASLPSVTGARYASVLGKLTIP